MTMLTLGAAVRHRPSGRTGWIVQINDRGYILHFSMQSFPLIELEPI